MAIIARLAGEGIGPFKSFDFDFSDANGNPHPGPHIFAGINGSGKSTVLRTLAWVLEPWAFGLDLGGFQWQEWDHLTEGYPASRAMVEFFVPDSGPAVLACAKETKKGWPEDLRDWIGALLASGRTNSSALRHYSYDEWPGSAQRHAVRAPEGRMAYGGSSDWGWTLKMLAVAYGPSRLLRHLPQVNLAAQLKDFRENALSFESTIRNEEIQSWLLNLFSKRAIAKERGENLAKYSTSLERFEKALTLICGQDIGFTVDIEPALQPRLLMHGKPLDFSQLPDGVRSTAGWVADFLMRMDLYESERLPVSGRSCTLLLDEIDAHLHPRWQRSILPSIKQALPEVQVFATSHSPFVIASCPGARIHVLDLDNEGVARNRPAVDAPVGESILATIKDIFGVDSRFDIETEKLLEEWNELHRGQAKGTLSPKERGRLAELTTDLSSRSEELRHIVSPVVSINDSLLASLKSKARTGQQNHKKKSKRG